MQMLRITLSLEPFGNIGHYRHGGPSYLIDQPKIPTERLLSGDSIHIPRQLPRQLPCHQILEPLNLTHAIPPLPVTRYPLPVTRSRSASAPSKTMPVMPSARAASTWPGVSS